jgi:sialate O-acetylesterase
MNNMNELRVPKLISDGMVLQRVSKVKIWGWADAGEKVTVSFLEKTYSATANEEGKWAVILDELQAGGPYNMEITAGTTLVIKNVLVGDVWICSGQSNMVIPMDRVKDLYRDEIANCDNTLIRQFTVPDRYDFNHPKEDLEAGKWEAASAENILQFSAVGYFFAKELFEKYHVPIGLIRASVGGSPVEAWISEDALKIFPEYLRVLEPLREDSYIKKVKEEDEVTSSSWFNKLDLMDKGMQKGEKCWFDPDYDASGWKATEVPGNWQQEGIGRLNGAVWFRKEINVPPSMTGKPARLLMGRIVDSDRAYINGNLVGSTS